MDNAPDPPVSDDPEMSDDERRHHDETARMWIAAGAESDRFQIQEYKRAIERGENPDPPVLCAEREARDERERLARRAAAPPYTGPPRRFHALAFLYGYPADLRDDELELHEREHRRPWSYETELMRRAEDAKKKA
jgi:hypothetical protein